MPDAGGNIKGISTGGKAGETIERIFGQKSVRDCGQNPATCKWGDACADCRLPDIDMMFPDCHTLIRSGRHPIYCNKPRGHYGECWNSERRPCVP